MPVIGSGHPLADVMLLKYQAQPSECHEGVAFFGRGGTAIMKSCQRLGIDPLQLYGTNVVKCGQVREAQARGKCLDHLRKELAIVEPKIVVAMGERTVEAINLLKTPLALDEQRLKSAFWRAFRKLGEWYEAIPPY
jgi:uracil-DNA glycosylase family 4